MSAPGATSDGLQKAVGRVRPYAQQGCARPPGGPEFAVDELQPFSFVGNVIGRERRVVRVGKEFPRLEKWQGTGAHNCDQDVGQPDGR